ncbi:hypothetical protein D3C79_701710 [compost metagenome]
MRQQQPQILRILHRCGGMQHAVALQPRHCGIGPQRQQRAQALRLLRQNRPLRQRNLEVALLAQALLRCLFGNALRITAHHRQRQRLITAPAERGDRLIHLLFLSHNQQTGKRYQRQHGDNQRLPNPTPFRHWPSSPTVFAPPSN